MPIYPYSYMNKTEVREIGRLGPATAGLIFLLILRGLPHGGFKRVQCNSLDWNPF